MKLIKAQIQSVIDTAVTALQADGVLPDTLPSLPQYIERTTDPSHGDFASNIALILAKVAGCKPRDLAEQIVAKLPEAAAVERVTIAGPGFINVFLSAQVFHQVIDTILSTHGEYGRSIDHNGQRVHIEYVSANPTGPLHVGHGRGAAYGDVVSNLLEAVGYNVWREYYVNDAGRQMHILAISVWLRYLALCGEPITFPDNAYRGDYVIEIAETLKAQAGDRLSHSAEVVFAHLPSNSPEEAERYLDALITRAQSVLGEGYYKEIFDFGLRAIQRDIAHDLENFGVCYQSWFPESQLVESGMLATSLERLKDAGHVYQQDGAVWFRATDFGDEKDRVLIKRDGQHTYFATDIAYHLHKYSQGYDRIIDIFGADHHGYMPRIRGFLKALDCDDTKLDIRLVQFVTLYRGKTRVSMSTRSGEFVTLRDLYEEVGKDATRFFYVMRKAEQHLDFDMALAKSASNDNPVYYIQYAHARICSVLRQAVEKNSDWDQQQGLAALSALTTTNEAGLMRQLADYPEVVNQAAERCAPHHLARYLQDLAHAFHSYYNAQQFLVEDVALRSARLCLILSVKQVLSTGLAILGVSAPEEM